MIYQLIKKTRKIKIILKYKKKINKIIFLEFITNLSRNLRNFLAFFISSIFITKNQKNIYIYINFYYKLFF